ncbi:hypothetical protein KCP71_18460 [Salmonella enterica subsp. enterica]|nr:hypothetical protein KCP71_18460 [Salmonella enterica subsp. enterica]
MLRRHGYHRRRRAQERLRMANTDTVTGLPIAMLFMNLLSCYCLGWRVAEAGIVYLTIWTNFKRKLMTPMGICLRRSALTGRFAGAVELCLEEDQCWPDWGDEFIVLAAHTSRSSNLTNPYPSAATVFVLDSLKFTRDARGISLAPARTGQRRSHSHCLHRNV